MIPSENELIKLDASLAVIKRLVNHLECPNSSRPLPLVISGNKLHIPVETRIGSVNIDAFNSMSLHTFDSPDGSTIRTIAAAGNDGAIYSVIKTESFADQIFFCRTNAAPIAKISKYLETMRLCLLIIKLVQQHFIRLVMPILW